MAAGNKAILSKSIAYTNEIILSYKDYVISFEYAALNFVSPEKNKYAYIMEGLEKEWNDVQDRRFVTYTTLPPGDYEFKVKGSNNDGVWNEEGVSLKIKITPPFWKTTWFRIFGIGIILLVMVVVFRMRTHAIRERSRELENHVEVRTTELSAANRMLKKEVTIRKRMQTDAQRRAEQASLIYMIGQRVSSELGLQTLLNEIVDSVREEFDYYSVALFMINKKSKDLILQAIDGGNAQIALPGSKLKLGQGIVGNVALNGKTKISKDIRKDPQYTSFGEEKTKTIYKKIV